LQALHDATYAVGRLDEACTIAHRLWTEAEPFDIDGTYQQFIGAFCSPKLLQPEAFRSRSVVDPRRQCVWPPNTSTGGTCQAGRVP